MPASDNMFTGSIPALYDRNLGPLLFEPYARNIAEQAAVFKPVNVLETAAGGIAARECRMRIDVVDYGDDGASRKMGN